MKNYNLILKVLASLSSGILWGFAYQAGLQSLLAFFAMLPLLWLISVSKGQQAYIFPILSSLIAVLIADNTLWQRMSIGDAAFYIIIQTLIFYIPWFLYQLVRSRHNQKLAYVALVSSFLTLEWTSSQIFGPWQALQLGFAPAAFPDIIQWYGLLGATAGSLWVLSMNIQLFRIIWPSTSYTRKSAIINGTLVLLLPIFYFFLSPTDNYSSNAALSLSTEKNLGSKENNSTICVDCSTEMGKTDYLRIKGAPAKGLIYNAAADTLSYVFLKTADAEKQVFSDNLMTIGIGGNILQAINKVKFGGYDIGLINNPMLLRPESIRLIRSQSKILLSTYHDKENSPQNIKKVAGVRAIENGISIVSILADKTVLITYPSGYNSKHSLSDKPISFQPASDFQTFYAQYGDLTGRLSIFVSVWMLLGAIVKPFRKK